MRYPVTVVLNTIVASWAVASTLVLAQSANPMIWAVARHVDFAAFELNTHRFQCPTGSIPISFSFVTKTPSADSWVENDRSLIDRNGARIARSSIVSLDQLEGGGLSLSIYNVNCHGQQFEGALSCMSTSTSTDNRLVMAKASSQAARNATAVVTAFCPADHPVAVGGFSNADGSLLQDTASAPAWGTSANPIFLSDVPDGNMGPPTGWRATVNNIGPTTVPVDSIAVCASAPAAQTFIYSSAVPQTAFGTKPFSVFAPVPDGWTAIGSGYDGGQYGRLAATDVWTGDGLMISMLPWFGQPGDYNSRATDVRAFNVLAHGNAPSGTVARAVAATIAIPRPAAAPTSATIVEYYHAALDHYFITGIPKEIADLDNGVHSGWSRTGQTFKAYGIGSTGRTGRRPVCRIYGLPLAGIDSHFYSASLDECTQTMVNFGDAWLRPGTWTYESGEVFQMDLPDPVTGACPAGGVPIHRVFNQRKDANHRYTTSIAIRDQMVARGGVAEGYGPDAVVLCGLQ